MGRLRRPKREFRNLAEWRDELGLNQREAAAVLGISQTTYGRLERGVVTAVRGKAKRIMATTGVPIESLVGVS